MCQWQTIFVFLLCFANLFLFFIIRKGLFSHAKKQSCERTFFPFVFVFRKKNQERRSTVSSRLMEENQVMSAHSLAQQIQSLYPFKEVVMLFYVMFYLPDFLHLLLVQICPKKSADEFSSMRKSVKPVAKEQSLSLPCNICKSCFNKGYLIPF